MRHFLIIFITSLLYVLLTSIDVQTHRNSGDMIMVFWLITIPITCAVCIFNFLILVYKRTKKQPSIILRVFIFWFVLVAILFIITLPDFLGNNKNTDNNNGNSYFIFFMDYVMEAFTTISCFSIIIPLLDIFLRRLLLTLKPEVE